MNAGQELGLKTPERATYKEACEAGWAPPPENETQKAIFDQFGKKE